MSAEGLPVGGLRTVGQIMATNPLRFYAEQNGLAIAIALLSTHTAGAPVVDGKSKYLDFINEYDVMKVLESGKNMNKLTAEDIMRKDRIVVSGSTPITKAYKIMEEHRVLNLPVENNGKVVCSVSRHDLLRSWIGLGPQIED